jgi:lysophospholipase L1-like esterase
MHYGTNDIWDNQPPTKILSAYLSVIREFRAENPNVVFFVSRIIKLAPSGCSYCLKNVGDLAAALDDEWANNNSTPSSKVFLVDNYASGFDPADPQDTSDGVHPTQTGAQKAADATVAVVIAKNYF